MNSFLHISQLFIITFLLWNVHVHCDTLKPSIRQRYQQWLAKHHKSYPNSIERENRFRIFQQNVKFIDEHNANVNKSYTLGLNQFSDLTNEERIARFTGAFRPHLRTTSSSYKPVNVSLVDLPKSWDWRDKGAVTPVKTQTCGNCWVFNGVAEVESINFIATGKLQVLSEQEIMDCDDLPGRGGCDGGWAQEVYEYVKHYNLTTEENYPTKSSNETCNISKKGKGRVARVTSFVEMPAYLSDEELMAAVVKQPVSVGIDISSPALAGYESGIFNGPCDFNLNHVVQIVGFGETKDGVKYWIARNSWSAGWGESGYARIQMGTGRKEGLCGINLWPSYPVY